MSADLCNVPVRQGVLSNRVGGGFSLATVIAAVNRTVTRPSAMSDESLVQDAIERRGGRPLTSYRSLEDLMRDFGD